MSYPDISQEALDHRGQQGHQAIRVFVIRAVRGINHCRAPKDEGTRAFDERLLCPSRNGEYLGARSVDRLGRLGFAPSDSAPLQTVVGVI